MATPTKEELTDRAQLVRIFEASCAIKFPTADEVAFRRSVMIKLGLGLGLKEVRNATIEGAGATVPQRGGRRT